MPPVGYLRRLSLAWCALLALYGCDRVAGSAGHSGRDSARDSGGDSVGGVAPAGPDTAARARMTPVEQVSLFWERVGREPRGRVCISTPATECPKEPVEVAVQTVGLLKVPTGRIIACDPTGAMFPQDTPPFARRYPVGEWPVELYSIIHPSRGARGVHLAAVVRAGGAAVARWEVASPARADVRPNRWPDDGQPWLVSVDGGMAGFVDQAGMAALGKAAEAALRQADPQGLFGLRTRSLLLESDPASNVVMFWSGAGDGAYPCFVGLSEDGQPVALLILFDTFDADRTAAAG